MKKVLIFLLVTGALAGWLFYQIYYAGNTRTPGGKTGYLLVPRGAGFEQLVDSLKINEYLKHEAFFRWAARHASSNVTQVSRSVLFACPFPGV